MSFLKDKKIKKGFLKQKKSKQVFIKNNINFDIEFEEDILTQKYAVVDRISNLLELPKKGECLKVMTTKNILSSEILDVINNKHKIIDIDLTFVVISKTAAKQIKKYKINNLVTRKYFDKYIEKYENIILSLNAKNIIRTVSHCKNYLIRCEDGNYITVITSANPKVSSDIENYHIYNSKTQYDNLKRYYTNEIANK